MDYNWCHGPRCHERQTTTRVRGVKGSKVLRTIKIKQGRYNYSGRPELITYDDYFCDQTCLMDFVRTHLTSIVAIAPRPDALETPIQDPKKTTHTNNYGYSWTSTEIKRVDNA